MKMDDSAISALSSKRIAMIAVARFLSCALAM